MNARLALGTLSALTLLALAPAETTGAAPAHDDSAPADVHVDVHVGETLADGVTEPPTGPNNSSLADKFGTKITLTVKRPQGDIIGLDRGLCALEGITDDKGTDLMKVLQKGRKRPWPVRWRGAYSGDGKSIDQDFWFPSVPAAEATRVAVRGRVALLCGSEPVTTDFITIDLRENKETRARVGDTDVTIETCTSEDKDFGMQVSLKAKSIAPVRDVQFFDGDGKAVASAPNGGGSAYTGDVLEYEKRDWRLKQPTPKVLRAKVAYFKTVRAVPVPLRGDVPLKPFPTGPLTSAIDGGPVGLRLEVKYDRVALKDAGMSPQDVDAQVRRYLEGADVITLEQLNYLPVHKPDGGKTFLFALVDSIQVKLERRPPAG